MGICRALFTLRNLVRLAAALVIGAVQIYLDPFGFSDATREISYRAVNRIVGPAVEWTAFRKNSPGAIDDGDLFPAERSRIRDDIVLVVLREEDVKRYGEIWKRRQAWPLPFGAHAEVIGRIRLGEPRAVYVDFVFNDERDDESLRSLLWAVEEYDRTYWIGEGGGEPTETTAGAGPVVRDIPIYFAGLRHRVDNVLSVIDDLRELKNVNVVAARRKRGSDYILWDRPKDREVQALEKIENYVPAVSPALAIYIDQCRLGAPINCPGSLGKLKSDWLAKPDAQVYAALRMFSEDMQIFWGATPSPRNFNEFVCNSEISYQEYGLHYFLKYYLNYVGRGFEETDCYHNPVATVSSLFRSRPEDVDKLLKDKIVIYTADIAGVSREIHPPTSARDLPFGVKHATALENLLAWGEQYLKTENTSDAVPVRIEDGNFAMFVFAVITVIALVASTWMDTKFPIESTVMWRNIGYHVIRDAGLTVSYVLIIVGIMMLQILIFRVTNLNYIEIILLSVGLFVIERNKYVLFLEELFVGRADRTSVVGE
ncbi:hypothetical protein GCM10017083_16470 [Thalassobaculum fulvum]|uniref:CHASE2 domain-containing protein n=2 Tax=Thalassobaculum fulvum TaxID=1633335 RepID=A0A918XQG9_9PROT|nr:hypothetical protein GCM10017083_16470 [Thalassobaculum fulvum]